MKGRARAPPGIECIIGVSTSRNPSSSKKFRISRTTRERTSNTRRESSLTMRSDVALTVPGFLVAEAVELFRQHPERLVEQRRLGRTHRQFAPVSAHEPAAHPDDVADIPQRLDLVVRLGAEVVPGEVALYAAAHVLQRHEAGLAHHPAQHDPAGDRGELRLRFQGGLVTIREVRLQRPRLRLAAEPVGVGTARSQPSPVLGAAALDDVALVAHRQNPAFRLASMKPSMSPFSTAVGSERSTLVLRSFTRDWSST